MDIYKKFQFYSFISRSFLFLIKAKGKFIADEEIGITPGKTALHIIIGLTYNADKNVMRKTMTKEMDVVAKLRHDMSFAVETGSGYTIQLDMAEGEGGEGRGAQPMEMLLVGLAGCAGMSNLLILRKRKQDIRNYEIRIHGERADLHPQVFIEMTVEHVITGKELKPEVVERAIRMTEQKYCGASVMLEKTARIRHTYRLIEVE